MSAMSIGGPCLWLSSLSPPTSSHLSAITAHFSTFSGTAEHIQSTPNSDPARVSWALERGGHSPKGLPVEMQQTARKAENALSSHATCHGSETRKDPENLNAGSKRGTPLSRMELPKLDCSGPCLSLSRDPNHLSRPGNLEQGSNGRQPDGTQEVDRDNGELTTPSDEGMASPASAEQPKSTADKKRMKRFRLTHNQTRFLMSEFTRQAHPDAAHRERLSREIPGLSPRQVQVWFQNRRAKLKRLTSNDRERMIKSRALPDDFDTTRVLRSPFDTKPTSESFPPPRSYITSNADPSFRMLPTPTDEDYVISPLSSTSANGHCFPSATPRKGLEGFPQSFGRTAMPERISELQRDNPDSLPFSRPSSFSESCTQPPLFNAAAHQTTGFLRSGADPLAHPGMAYARRVVDYGMPKPHGGMIVGYENQRHLEGSVSPTESQDAPVHHRGDAPTHTYQSPLTIPAPKGYSGMQMSSQLQPHGRHIPSLHTIPVSDPSDYRPFSYDNSPYTMNPTIPFTQANASSISLPASFAPSEAPQANVFASTEDRTNQQHVLAPLRTKFSNPPFEYAPYI